MKAVADQAEIASRDFDAEAFARESTRSWRPACPAVARSWPELLNSVPMVMDFAQRLIDKGRHPAPDAPGVDDMLRRSKS